MIEVLHFTTPITFCKSALVDALMIIGPSFIYTVRVCKDEVPVAIRICTKWNAIYEANPLCPYINIIADDQYVRGEWSIEANGKCMHSPGVGGCL